MEDIFRLIGFTALACARLVLPATMLQELYFVWQPLRIFDTSHVNSSCTPTDAFIKPLSWAGHVIMGQCDLHRWVVNLWADPG